MNEEQYSEIKEGKKSVLGKMLLHRVVSHKFFSEKVLFWVLLSIPFLLPIIFVPLSTMNPEFTKMVFLEIAVLLGVLMWAFGRLRDGHISVPKSFLLGVGVLLTIWFVVSAFVSPVPMVSFIGSGYDLGTVNSFLLLFLLMFLGANVFTSRDRILSLYAAFIFSGVIVLIYHLLRHFFGPDFLDFGIFNSAVSTMVGKWNDFATLLGGLLILSVLTIYFFPQNKSLKLPVYTIFTVSLFFLLLIDFTVLWVVLLFFSLAIATVAIYEGELRHKQSSSVEHEEGTHRGHKHLARRMIGHLPVMAIIIFVVSLVYATGISGFQWGKEGTNITTMVSKTLRATPYSEVVLTPKATYEIISATLKDSPVFGTGPNRFAQSFLLHKTTEINRTPFWDTTFDFGLGRIPTYFGTMGVIGLLLWVGFIILLVLKVRFIKKLFAKDRVAAYLAVSLFLMTLYFWSFAFFYLPNIAIYALAFLFAGALLAFLVGEGEMKLASLHFGEGTRMSTIVTPIIIVLLIGVVSGGVLLYRQVSSLVAFQDAQLALSQNKIDQAEASVLHANGFAERDVHHRMLSSIALVRLTQLSAQQLPSDQFQAKANQLINDARTNAERAVGIDPTNFENYLQLGGVYDTLGSLGVQNTASPARDAYQQALGLNPKSPRVLFVLARLEFLSGDRAKARTHLLSALAERPNYLEAISFLVQLDLQDKNIDEAITVLQNGIVVEPTNFLMRFALGYLYYSKKDYNGAMEQFQSAVALNPIYADAKYFLGLSYFKVGRKDDAIQQFVDVQTLNPDSKDVEGILKNLRAGRDPFDEAYVAPTQPVSSALEDLGSDEEESANQ